MSGDIADVDLRAAVRYHGALDVFRAAHAVALEVYGDEDKAAARLQYWLSFAIDGGEVTP